MASNRTFNCEPNVVTSPPSSEPQDLAAQFELMDMIGEGGMGSVWRARDRMLGIDVAIKVISPDVQGPTAAGRLVSEARAAARVRHPSAVRVLRSGISAAGNPFIVMELLDGEPLDEVLEMRGKLTGEDACALLLPIISAVAAAHDQGIVHRDIKPSNIFMHREGERLRPKLLDFGIAKQTRDVDASVTLPGAIMGTPNYMSPEQAYGQPDIDQRADVWGMCAVLYEMVAGHPPFDGENYNQVISAVLCSDAERPAGIDDWLWDIIARGLQRERDERWTTARALGRQVAGWLVHHGVENDITNSAIRSGSLRPEAMPALPPSSASVLSTTGTMTLPPAPRLPSMAPGGRGTWVVAGLGLAIGVVLAVGWLAQPKRSFATQVPRQAAAGPMLLVNPSVVPPPRAPERRHVRRKKRVKKEAPPVAVEVEASANVKVAPVGPGKHGMPIPSKAGF